MLFDHSEFIRNNVGRPLYGYDREVNRVADAYTRRDQELANAIHSTALAQVPTASRGTWGPTIDRILNDVGLPSHAEPEPEPQVAVNGDDSDLRADVADLKRQVGELIRRLGTRLS